MYCGSCGSKIDKNTKFCQMCGAPIGKENIDINPSVVVQTPINTPYQDTGVYQNGQVP